MSAAKGTNTPSKQKGAAKKKRGTAKRRLGPEILEPAVLSRHHEAIREAVEKVFAAREAAAYKPDR